MKATVEIPDVAFAYDRHVHHAAVLAWWMRSRRAQRRSAALRS